MVDPNRKINHLTDDDVNFLQECENEFKNRFTDMDEEFQNHCKSVTGTGTTGINVPPIIFPWNGRRPQQGNYRGGFNHRNNNYHGHRGRGGHGGGGGNYNRNNSYGGGGNYNRNNQRYGSNYNRNDSRGSEGDGQQRYKRPHDDDY